MGFTNSDDDNLAQFITPPKIAVICLIEVYCSRLIALHARTKVLMLLLNWIDAKYSCLFLLKLEDFESALKDIPTVHNQTVRDVLLQRIAEIYSIDVLYSVISDIDDQFFIDPESKSGAKRTLVSSTSVVGHFLRRCYVDFKAMEFERRLDLWQSFCLFSGRNSFDGIPAGFPVPLLSPVADSNDTIASEDVTRLFEFQIEYMQKHGCSLTKEMLERLEYVVTHTSKIPSSVYYIRFLHGWRSGDYQEAFENLHRYFDYTMHNNDKLFYQYALLNLAILQAEFNCFSEAVWAIQETIKTARENKDSVCLNFAMSWLYHFQKSHPRECPPPTNSDEATLQFLKIKSKESGMLNLQSIVYLSEAKTLITTGGSIVLIFEALTKSSYINAQTNLLESVGAQYVIQSTLWTRLGVSSLGRCYTDIYLGLFKEKAFVEDMVKIVFRSAYALVNIGKYDDALKMLSEVESIAAQSLRIHQIWVSYNLLILFKRAIKNSRFTEAEILEQRLKAIDDVLEDCVLEIEWCRIELYLRTGRAEAALTRASECLDLAVGDSSDINSQLVFMIAYSRTMLQLGRPLRGYALLMRCIAMAEKACLVPTMLDSVCYLCEIFNSIKQHQPVLAVLDIAMPQIIECENTELLGRAYFETVKAIVGASNLSSTSGGGNMDLETKGKMAHAIRYAKLAYAEFERMEDVSVMIQITSMLTRLYKVLGPENSDDCDSVAKMTQQLQKLRIKSRQAGMLT
ncbi:anaphase-promoting complex subunit 5-domain-containing protein [Lipomyces arxii]|uniref:anaphase-promoting complex subunit 5-domain-containing protein n=1 Tax=Lipomyces arxii TaxID=56418 RepID=UPI0034CF7428